MITIPLYIILFIYLAYILVLGILAFVDLANLFRNGALTFVSFMMTFLVIALTIFTLYFTYSFLMNVDWQQTLTIWNNDWITNVLNPTNF